MTRARINVPDGFLTVTAWARRRRKSRRTVLAWCASGVLPGAIRVPCPGKYVRDANVSAFAWVIPVGARVPQVKRGRPLKGEAGGLAAVAATRQGAVDASRHENGPPEGQGVDP